MCGNNFSPTDFPYSLKENDKKGDIFLWGTTVFSLVIQSYQSLYDLFSKKLKHPVKSGYYTFLIIIIQNDKSNKVF